MAKYHIVILIVGLSFLKANSQSASKYLVPFRSIDNKYFWKNNIRNTDYWQQDVAYKIKASIDAEKDIVNGESYQLTYWNNSPDELNELYFHLYENAFQPESYYHDLWKANNLKPVFGKKYESQKKGTELADFEVNYKKVKTELDNTILKVFLNESLKPGDSLVVTCSFKTYWDTGSMRRRNKTYNTFGFKHYDGVHWYPIICVYDAKFGWHTDQHLDKEFYADFGSFNMELTFPQEFIVEGSGVLLKGISKNSSAIKIQIYSIIIW